MARGLVPAVNRVTGIYEREIGVHLNLVANNDLIIFNTPAQRGQPDESGLRR